MDYLSGQVKRYYFPKLSLVSSSPPPLLQTTLKAFKKTEFSCIREHEEFVWLHDRFVENEDYAGVIVSCILKGNVRRSALMMHPPLSPRSLLRLPSQTSMSRDTS